MPSTTRQPRLRSLIALLAALIALVLVAGPSVAASPKFKDAYTTLVFPHRKVPALTARKAPEPHIVLPDLRFSFTLVGLGSAEARVKGKIGAATAEFGCVNTGGNRPKASNKTQISLPLSASDTFTADRNGRVVGSVLVDTAPLEDPTLSCPPGQELVAISLRLDDLTVEEVASGTIQTLPSVFVKLLR